MKHAKMMDHPSNGISIWGHLKPAFLEEEYYVRKLFHDDEASDGYTSDWKGKVKQRRMLGISKLRFKSKLFWYHSFLSQVLSGEMVDGAGSLSVSFKPLMVHWDFSFIKRIVVLISRKSFLY